jgi:hypothetical protein
VFSAVVSGPLDGMVIDGADRDPREAASYDLIAGGFVPTDRPCHVPELDLTYPRVLVSVLELGGQYETVG